MPLIHPLAAPGSPGRFLGLCSRLRSGRQLVCRLNHEMLDTSADLHSIPLHRLFPLRLSLRNTIGTVPCRIFPIVVGTVVRFLAIAR